MVCDCVMLCRYMHVNVGRWSEVGRVTCESCVSRDHGDTSHDHRPPSTSHLYLRDRSVNFPARCQVSAKTICCHVHSRVFKQICLVFLVRKPLLEIVLLLDNTLQATILGSTAFHSLHNPTLSHSYIPTGSLVSTD